jgi:hypothetical protein
VDLESQIRLASLLRYYRRGSFSSFSRAAISSGATAGADEPHLVANLLLAFQLAGICEVALPAGRVEWRSAHDTDIVIASTPPKTVVATRSCRLGAASPIVPLIVSQSGIPLVLGASSENPISREPTVFHRPITSLLRDLPAIESLLFAEVPYSTPLEGVIESFDPATGRWEPVSGAPRGAKLMLRARAEVSGVTYYVQHTDLSLRFKVLQPEWAFVVAFHLLPWRIRDALVVDDAEVRVPRAFRLPTVFYRALFASASSVKIGAQVSFRGLSSTCIAGLLSYFPN